MKFSPDIHPTESGLFQDKIWIAWNVEMSPIKSFFRFFLKKSCVNFHAVWGIPKQYIVGGLLKEIYEMTNTLFAML